MISWKVWPSFSWPQGLIEVAFYDPPKVEVQGKWLAWLRRWKALVLKNQSATVVAENMKTRNPKCHG